MSSSKITISINNGYKEMSWQFNNFGELKTMDKLHQKSHKLKTWWDYILKTAEEGLSEK